MERALVRVGVHDHVARLLAATPSLRASWLAAAGVAVGFSTWAATAGPEGRLVFLTVAPVVPVAGVAAAYGPWADPMHELASATPLHGLRLVLLRATAVLIVTTVLTGIAGAIAPVAEVGAFAWVLPALALTLASLALGTFVPPHVAGVVVAALWFATVFGVELRSHERFGVFRGAGQITFFIVVVASTSLIAWRRERVEVASRTRARRGVEAVEAERRRIERNIHDGAQQQLVAISVKVGLVKTFVERDPARAALLLEELHSETLEALESLRDLTRGADPPILVDHGLAAALTHRATRSPVPVHVEADDVGRVAREIETAVYFCCLEALQNATKYARASRITVSVRCVGGSVSFDVVDDGAGFEPATVRRGIGLRSIKERIDILGGSLEIRSSPGAGTTIAGRIPLPSQAEVRRPVADSVPSRT